MTGALDRHGNKLLAATLLEMTGSDAAMPGKEQRVMES
jgi:hypothetical protein